MQVVTAAVVIQAFVRGWAARRLSTKLKDAVITVQVYRSAQAGSAP